MPDVTPNSSSNAPAEIDSLFTPDAAQEYHAFLRELKERIQTAQIKASLAVNRELVLLYWSIGRDILARQQQQGWGAKVIEQLAKDLRSAFPDMKGFSRTNLLYMRAFAEAWPEEAIVQQLVGQLPWGHNIRLLDRVTDVTEREWYIRAAIEYGWSRSILEMQIETNLYARQGKAITNFERTLPKPQSDLAQQMLKDPYVFDFTGLSRETEDEDFFLDLLFYHLKLRCFVVIELKTTDFKPEYAGKMQFYVSAVDAQLKHADDSPTIGLILCKTKKRLIVEYTLRGTSLPMGVSEYHLAATLPDALKGSLPSIEELEAELSRGDAPQTTEAGFDE